MRARKPLVADFDHLQAGWVAAILRTYRSADPDAVQEGRDWYPSMVTIMREHAAESGLTLRQCAAIYAANSINTPWSRNIALAAQCIADFIDGNPVKLATLGMINRKCEAILSGQDVDASLTSDADNYKIRSFTRNLSGDFDAVTVDRWAMRIAYGLTKGGYVPKGAEYQAIANAYRAVAAIVGETPATVQAVTWVVIRGTGE